MRHDSCTSAEFKKGKRKRKRKRNSYFNFPPILFPPKPFKIKTSLLLFIFISKQNINLSPFPIFSPPNSQILPPHFQLITLPWLL
jgi:hypothetical protein